MNRYDQESKTKVRQELLGRAIVALTTERHSAALIARDELEATFNHFLDLIGHGFRTDKLRPAAVAELQEWMAFDAASNTPKCPGELKVLYLCGPSPVNDLDILLAHGINIHNVWAVTGSPEDSKEAHEQLASSIVGIYGRPYLYNAKQSYRVQYVSSVREMFCDLFVFEQCRSFFDWFPTVQACPSRFDSIPFQIVARCLIDRIGWANFHNTANPFAGSAIAGRGECWAANPLIYPERIAIS
jgi:hypothetical protein